MKEEWRDIEGFEGMYQISNFGNVRSLDRMVLKYGTTTPVMYLGKPLKIQVGPRGHLRVTLHDKDRKVTRSVAKLVAYHFVEGFKEEALYRNVKFKDGDCSNCRADNLM